MGGPLKDVKKSKSQKERVNCGFTSTVINGEEVPQCTMCCEVLANESYKLNKLMTSENKTELHKKSL
jgi:hypothetical protein